MSKNKKKIVCIGGGTGVSMILSGLTDSLFELGAVVTMFDDGGSSGKLAKEFHILPPGDVRQCLIATCEDKDSIDDFSYRFDKGSMKGHNFGNLQIVKAVNEQNGDWNKAIEKLSKKLNIKARIYPVTLKLAKIKAILNNKKQIIGEENIINSKEVSRVGVKKLVLLPSVKANQKAILAIKDADLIIIGPGKFYTSLMPNLLVGGIPEAIKKSKAKKVFICNLMTQEGNTDKLKVEDYYRILEEYLGKNVLDFTIFNTGKLDKKIIKKVKKIFPKTEFVGYDKKTLAKNNFIGADLLDNRIRGLNPADILVKGANHRTIVFHDSQKLAKIILNLLN
jgi:uncharacterized cofD-like protein